MNFKDYIHKNMDCGSYTNKLTSPSPVTFSEKQLILKTCVRPSSVLDSQKHLPVTCREQKLAHSFVSSINNMTKMTTLLQGYTGTVCYPLLSAQTHPTTSAFISDIQRNTEFSLQAFVAQEHAYRLIITLTTVSLVILL